MIRDAARCIALVLVVFAASMGTAQTGWHDTPLHATTGWALGGSAHSQDGRSWNLSLDVFSPEQNPPWLRPAVVFVRQSGHDDPGSCRGEEMYSAVTAFVDHAFAVFCMYYRTPDFGTASDMAGDIRRAVKFVRYEAQRYMIDPKRIVVVAMGEGSYLAGMAALDCSSDEVQHSPYPWDSESGCVSAVIFSDGPSESEATSLIPLVQKDAPSFLIVGEKPATARPQAAEFLSKVRGIGRSADLFAAGREDCALPTSCGVWGRKVFLWLMGPGGPVAKGSSKQVGDR